MLNHSSKKSSTEKKSLSNVIETKTTIINDPACLPGTSRSQSSTRTNNLIAQKINKPNNGFNQHSTMFNPLPFYSVSTSSSNSAHQTFNIYRQQTSTSSKVPLNNPFAIYAAQLAQYQAYQQMQQFGSVISTKTVNSTSTFVPGNNNSMIHFQKQQQQHQTPSLQQQFYVNPIPNHHIATPIAMMPIYFQQQQTSQILPGNSHAISTSNSSIKTSNNFNSENFLQKKYPYIKNNENGKKFLNNYFCEICKLVCKSPESMMKHMLGHKHQKRIEYLNLNNNNDNNNNNNNNNNKIKKLIIREPTAMSIMLKCRICDVSCVSIDSYSSHLQGQRHNRSIDYRKKIGETLSNDLPEIISKNVSKELEMKINELFGGEMNNDSKKYSNINDNNNNKNTNDESEINQSKIMENSSTNSNINIKDLFDCKPIGEEFIEKVLNQNGKIVYYACTLCECRFNDLNAKNLHLKGRKHRLQYKKKVDPNLIIEFIKSDMIKLEKEQLKNFKRNKYIQKNILHTRPYLTEDLDPFQSVEKSKEFSTIFKYNQNNIHSHTSIYSSSLIINQRNEYIKTFSDYILEYKHHLIQPKKSELDYIYQTAYLVEKAIRNVGRLIEQNFLLSMPISTTILGIHKKLLPIDTIINMLENDSEKRLIPIDTKLVEFIRVVRPGSLGKGLLLTGEKYFKLIILSSILPTKSMLKLFEKLVPKEIERLSRNNSNSDYSDEYFVQSELNLDKIKFSLNLYTFKLPSSLNKTTTTNNNDLTNIDDSKKLLQFDCYLTCPYYRNKDENELLKLSDYDDLLNQNECIKLLDDIKHFRWFKDLGIKHNFFTFLLRIFRDLSKRIKIWSHLSLWTFEVILEKILISANCYLGPSSIFRHVFEFLANGVLMKRGHGLADPCEARLINVFDYLDNQQREDIMFSAQHLLRKIAFNQLDNVLDVDAKIVFQIRMNEIEQMTSSSNNQTKSMDKQEIKSNNDDNYENTQQKTQPELENKFNDEKNVEISLKRKLSNVDYTFEEPDLE